jgi:hypothetical protein
MILDGVDPIEARKAKRAAALADAAKVVTSRKRSRSTSPPSGMNGSTRSRPSSGRTLLPGMRIR